MLHDNSSRYRKNEIDMIDISWSRARSSEIDLMGISWCRACSRNMLESKTVSEIHLVMCRKSQRVSVERKNEAEPIHVLRFP